MKIAVAQINPLVGDIEGNLKKHLEIIEKFSAEADRPELVVFPEMSLIGYPARDLLLHENIVEKAYTLLTEAAGKFTLPALIGLPTIDEATHRLHNSVAYVNNGKIEKLIHKKLLPNYEVFYEQRYFTPAQINHPKDFSIDVNGRKLAVLICEDLLAVEKSEHLYARKPLDVISKSDGFYAAICCSASPYRLGQPQRRIHYAQVFQKTLGCPVILVNQIGAFDDILFEGTSFALNNRGSLMKVAEQFQEDFWTIDLSEENTAQVDKESTIDEIKEALVLGIKDYFKKSGFKKAYLGISGGVDSALVAALAQKALGHENVYGIIMPTAYTSLESLKDAHSVVQNLGINSQTIDIEPILKSYLHEGKFNKLTLAEENLQSRIRGTLLMGLANDNGGLVLATGNKSEFAVGYSTLYGDMCGAIAPIGDLWKTQVWELAKTFLEINENIVSKPPTAELRPNQKDSDSLPEYEELDGILRLMIEKKLSREAVLKEGFDEEKVDRIFRLHKLSEFKRKQAPIILKVSNCAFGSGWMYPVVKI
jgi:NAD+ synthase (glutamine-hydrolysing)